MLGESCFRLVEVREAGVVGKPPKVRENRNIRWICLNCRVAGVIGKPPRRRCTTPRARGRTA